MSEVILCNDCRQSTSGRCWQHGMGVVVHPPQEAPPEYHDWVADGNGLPICRKCGQVYPLTPGAWRTCAGSVAYVRREDDPPNPPTTLTVASGEEVMVIPGELARMTPEERERYVKVFNGLRFTPSPSPVVEEPDIDRLVNDLIIACGDVFEGPGSEWDENIARRDALEKVIVAAFASLRADKDRMDWLFSTLNTQEIFARINRVGIEYCERGFANGIHMGDFRAAIDTARSAGETNG